MKRLSPSTKRKFSKRLRPLSKPNQLKLELRVISFKKKEAYLAHTRKPEKEVPVSKKGDSFNFHSLSLTISYLRSNSS